MPSRRLPTVQERLARLEEAMVNLIAWSTDNQSSRLALSLAAPTSGESLVEFLNAIASEADLRVKGAEDD